MPHTKASGSTFTFIYLVHISPDEPGIIAVEVGEPRSPWRWLWEIITSIGRKMIKR